MRKQMPGTPLMVEGEESDWKVSVPLEELRRLLGLPLLVEFCRCSVAADRLTSLGDFAFFNEEWKPRQKIAYERDLQTMFWFTCGTLHEAIDALDEMELLGIEGLLGSLTARKPWLELRSISMRWKEDPIYRRVRDKIAFHLDPAAIRRGINKPGRDADPIVWKTGDSRKERSTFFNFAEDCLVATVLPEDLDDAEAQKRFGDFAERVSHAHLGFSHWVQELFIAAVRGAALGLKTTPLERSRAEGLSQERLEEITAIAGEMSAGGTKDALADVLREVSRLSGILRRTVNEQTFEEAQRRRNEEEQRLRAVAATAKQFLLTDEPGAERRLRELLELTGEE
jgi:hypothetical protein